MRRFNLWFALFSLLTLVALGGAQQLTKKMNNQDVLDMASLGLSDDVIVDKIHTAPETDFNTNLDALKALKAAKVSDAVIRAMINPHPAMPQASAAAPAAANGPGMPEDIGVYLILRGKLTEVEPEVVGWQSGGFMKSMATGGLTKGHVNGKIMKPKSALQATNPFEFIIKTPEGTSVTEYQLLKLDEKSDRREFRAMTGGIIHASGGAEKNAIQFTPEKIGPRLWRVKIADLQKGEYGFLPPGVNSASISSSGKIYSFSAVE